MNECTKFREIEFICWKVSHLERRRLKNEINIRRRWRNEESSVQKVRRQEKNAVRESRKRWEESEGQAEEECER